MGLTPDLVEFEATGFRKKLGEGTPGQVSSLVGSPPDDPQLLSCLLGWCLGFEWGHLWWWQGAQQ